MGVWVCVCGGKRNAMRDEGGGHSLPSIRSSLLSPSHSHTLTHSLSFSLTLHSDPSFPSLSFPLNGERGREWDWCLFFPLSAVSECSWGCIYNTGWVAFFPFEREGRRLSILEGMYAWNE